MPRPGGESAKLGDQYEAVWTVDAAIDVFEGRFRSITVEAFGDESVGVEFHLETNEGVLQFHSVKRQKKGGDWSIRDLCDGHETGGRSILGDLFAKRTRWSNAETRFVSATGANELRELAEGCIGRLSARQLAPRILEIVSYYAINDSDPQSDIWQDTTDGRNYYGGDPHWHGINCVRGQAAEALSALLYDDHARFNALRPALVALSEDPIISVRTCALDAFLPLLNFARDFAVELFLKACDGCEAICATHPFDHFIHYAIYTHYAQLRELLEFALKSGNPKAVENSARQITLAELQDVAVGTDATDIRSGSETMRKAAADVYATNLSHEVVGNKCAERLEELFADESEAVRQEVSSAFFNLSGERLLKLKDFIARFIESRCFENETGRLLHALKESNVELPQIICRAAERILDFLGEEGTHLANRGAMTAHEISTLIVRQYEQTTDDAIKTWCLDLIDQMERVGYLGIGEELAKVDR